MTEPLSYVVYRTADSIKIDGRGDEMSWQTATWSESFTDIEGSLKPAPSFNTRFKMLWDNDNLFIYAEMEEPQIWAYLRKHDEIVFHDNDFEVFIDPDNDSQNYFEIEINAVNTVFDLFLSKPYRDGGSALFSWNAPGLKTAVAIDGTLNNPVHKDKKWSVEMAIPFQNVSLGNYTRVPKHGDFWRINFSRVEWDVEAKNGVYEKMRDPATNKPLPEHNWVWSPQGLIDMHYPERWGYAFFCSEPIGSSVIDFALPEDVFIRQLLWLCYYKQRDYKRTHSAYARELAQLGLDQNSLKKLERSGAIFSCDCSTNRFLIIAKDTCDNGLWQINELGIITQTKPTQPK